MAKNRRRLLVLFIILLCLALFLLIKKVLPLATSTAPDLFAGLKKEEVSEIDIQNENSVTKIVKNNNLWITKMGNVDYPADKDRVNKIIESFSSLKRGETSSKNKNNFASLGIGKIKLALITKNKNYSVYIGDNFSADKNYARIDSEDEVFVASGFSDILFPEDFRDLSVHFIDNENNVTYAQIDFSGKSTVLEKKNNDWYIDSNKVLKDRVDFFLNDLKTLKSSDIFIVSPIEGNYYPESLLIKLKENGTEKTAIFYQKDKTESYLKTSNSNYFFSIGDAYVSSLKKEGKDFMQ